MFTFRSFDCRIDWNIYYSFHVTCGRALATISTRQCNPTMPNEQQKWFASRVNQWETRHIMWRSERKKLFSCILSLMLLILNWLIGLFAIPIVLNDGNANYSHLHRRCQVQTTRGVLARKLRLMRIQCLKDNMNLTGSKYHSPPANVITMDFVSIYFNPTSHRLNA